MSTNRSKLFDSLLHMHRSGTKHTSTGAYATHDGTVATIAVGGYTEGQLVLDVACPAVARTAASGAGVSFTLRGFLSASATTHAAPLCKVLLGVPGYKGVDSAMATLGDPSGDLYNATVRIARPFNNEFAGTVYPYLKLYTAILGSWCTGIDYDAFLSV